MSESNWLSRHYRSPAPALVPGLDLWASLRKAQVNQDYGAVAHLLFFRSMCSMGLSPKVHIYCNCSISAADALLLLDALVADTPSSPLIASLEMLQFRNEATFQTVS